MSTTASHSDSAQLLEQNKSYSCSLGSLTPSLAGVQQPCLAIPAGVRCCVWLQHVIDCWEKQKPLYLSKTVAAATSKVGYSREYSTKPSLPAPTDLPAGCSVSLLWKAPRATATYVCARPCVSA